MEAGGIGPYPPDRPGTFTIPTPKRARNEILDGRVELVVRLEPAREGTELKPRLNVVVQAVELAARP
ncbi:MAG: hypothetical protein ABR613_07975 [Actinomycetota bacterium]